MQVPIQSHFFHYPVLELESHGGPVEHRIVLMNYPVERWIKQYQIGCIVVQRFRKVFNMMRLNDR